MSSWGIQSGVYGVKTGFTNGANRCLVTSVKRGNMDLISVVLGADTKKDRTKDSIKIIEYAYANYQMVDIGFMIHQEFDNIVKNAKFDVIKGKNSDEIGLYAVNKDDIKDIEIRFTY